MKFSSHCGFKLLLCIHDLMVSGFASSPYEESLLTCIFSRLEGNSPNFEFVVLADIEGYV